MNKLLERLKSKYGYVASSDSFDVDNPATGDILISLKKISNQELKKIIISCDIAQQKFAKTSYVTKSKLLRDFYNIVIANKEELAEIATLENGKCLGEARTEVLYAASFIEWYAEKAKRLDGEAFVHSALPNSEARVDYEPIGVVAAITPWNFPLAMITRKLAPALAAGCGVVVKPAELTPLSALALKELALDVDIADFLFQIVYGDAQEIGAELTSSKIVKKMTFTGSTRVGKILLSQSAETVKKVSLELGGNAPFIIFESADITKSVEGLIAAKLKNAGQVCIAPNRVFVQKSVKQKFILELKKQLDKIKVGNGLNLHSCMGPLINQQAVEKVEQHIKNAQEHGSKIIYGGKRHCLGGNFFEITVLDEMNDKTLTSCEEIFGPVIAIYSFESQEEVIERANNTDYGLASYFYSEDYKQIKKVREDLQAGMVAINTGVLSAAKAQFGGIKQSGLGREGSDNGIYEFLEAKYSLQDFS